MGALGTVSNQVTVKETGALSEVGDGHREIVQHVEKLEIPLGRPNLDVGAFENFLELKNLTLDRGASPELLKELISQGLAAAAEIGRSKADLLKASVEEVSTAKATEILKKIGKMGFENQAEGVIKTLDLPPGFFQFEADHPLVVAMGREYADRVLSSSILEDLNSVFGPLRFNVRRNGDHRLDVESVRPMLRRGELGPVKPELLEAFRSGQAMAVQERTKLLPLATLLGGEIVAQVTTQLTLAEAFKIGTQQEPVRHRRADGKDEIVTLSLKVDPTTFPESLQGLYKEITEAGAQQLWSQVRQIVERSLNLQSNSEQLDVGEVGATKIELTRRSLRAAAPFQRDRN